MSRARFSPWHPGSEKPEKSGWYIIVCRRPFESVSHHQAVWYQGEWPDDYVISWFMPIPPLPEVKP